MHMHIVVKGLCVDHTSRHEEHANKYFLFLYKNIILWVLVRNVALSGSYSPRGMEVWWWWGGGGGGGEGRGGCGGGVDEETFSSLWQALIIY